MQKRKWLRWLVHQSLMSSTKQLQLTRLFKTIAVIWIKTNRTTWRNCLNNGPLVHPLQELPWIAVRINVSKTRGNSPGALAFHRDILHNVPVQGNLPDIQHHQQVKVNKNLLWLNARHYRHGNCVGKRVIKRLFGLSLPFNEPLYHCCRSLHSTAQDISTIFNEAVKTNVIVWRVQVCSMWSRSPYWYSVVCQGMVRRS